MSEGATKIRQLPKDRSEGDPARDRMDASRSDPDNEESYDQQRKVKDDEENEDSGEG